jgi:hypothetical protein
MALALVRDRYKRVAARLMRQDVTYVKIKDGIITCKYDGRWHKDAIKIPKHVLWVGDWRRDKPIVREHPEITRNRKYAICLAVHETIERYVALKYGLPEVREAHIVANAVEYRLSRRLGVNWNNYGLWVEIIFRKESARLGRR